MTKYLYKLLIPGLLLIFLLNPAFPQSGRRSTEKPAEAREDIPDPAERRNALQQNLYGNKQTIANDSTRVLLLPVAYVPLQMQPDSLIETGAGNRTAKSANLLHQYRFGVGDLEQLLVQFARWQKLNNWEYRAAASFERNEGQYDNNKWRQGRFTGDISHWLAPQLKMLSSLAYDFYDYGLQASHVSEHQRMKDEFDFQWKLPFQVQDAAYGIFQLEYQYFQLKEKNANLPALARSRENAFALYGNYQWRFLNSVFSLKFRFDVNSHESSADSSFSDIISRLGAKMVHRFTPDFSINAAGELINFSLENGYSESQLAPSLTLNYAKKDRWGFHLTGERKFEYQSLYSFWEENLFVAHGVPSNVVEYLYSGEIAFEFEPQKDSFLSLEARHFLTRNWGYYEFDQYWFQRHLLDDVRQTQIDLNFKWKALPRLDLNLSAKFNITDAGDSLQENMDSVHLPYQEEVRVKFDFDYHYSSETNFKIENKIVSPRYTRLGSEFKLDSYFLVNMSFERKFNEYMTFYINLNNVLNQEYQVWENYKALGIHFMAGIYGKW